MIKSRFGGQNMVLFNRKDDYCGCTECKHICSVSAIDMVSDEDGFYILR